MVESWTVSVQSLSGAAVDGAGGYFAANVASLLGSALFVAENKSESVRPWLHGGWYVGTILAFVGAISGRFRFISGGASDDWDSTKKEEAAEPELDEAPAAEPTEPSAPDDSKRSSIAGAAGGLGLIGGFVGAMFGCSLLIVWFWLAYSPFRPAEWVASIEVEHERVTPSQQPTPVAKTDHPVALYLIGIPIAIGVAVGAIGGGVGAAFGKVRDG